MTRVSDHPEAISRLSWTTSADSTTASLPPSRATRQAQSRSESENGKRSAEKPPLCCQIERRTSSGLVKTTSQYAQLIPSLLRHMSILGASNLRYCASCCPASKLSA